MKFRRTDIVGKFEVEKVKNKGAVSENVVQVTISPRSPYVKKLHSDLTLCCSTVQPQHSQNDQGSSNFIQLEKEMRFYITTGTNLKVFSLQMLKILNTPRGVKVDQKSPRREETGIMRTHRKKRNIYSLLRRLSRCPGHRQGTQWSQRGSDVHS